MRRRPPPDGKKRRAARQARPTRWRRRFQGENHGHDTKRFFERRHHDGGRLHRLIPSARTCRVRAGNIALSRARPLRHGRRRVSRARGLDARSFRRPLGRAGLLVAAGTFFRIRRARHGAFGHRRAGRNVRRRCRMADPVPASQRIAGKKRRLRSGAAACRQGQHERSRSLFGRPARQNPRKLHKPRAAQGAAAVPDRRRRRCAAGHNGVRRRARHSRVHATDVFLRAL